MPGDDVEEVILPEDETQSVSKRDKSVLRNNFLAEDPPKAVQTNKDSGSVTILTTEEAVETVEREEASEREDYVQSITNKLI